MKTFYGADVSYAQGAINWPAFNPGAAFVHIKGGGGDAPGTNPYYVDAQLAANKVGVRSLGLEMPHMYYWYGGGVDAISEADHAFSFFCQDLQVGEGVWLDAERGQNGQQVTPTFALTWLNRMAQHVGFKPLVYLNDSTILIYDWTPVAQAGYGLIAADWAVSPAQNVPLKYWPFYAFQQYSDSGTFPGINGPVDCQAFFANELSDFYKYCKQAPIVVPAASPAPAEPPAQPSVNVSVAVTNTPAPTTTQPAVTVTTPSDQPTPPAQTTQVIDVVKPTSQTTADKVAAVVSSPIDLPQPNKLQQLWENLVDYMDGKKTLSGGVLLLAGSVGNFLTTNQTLMHYLTTLGGAAGAVGAFLAAIGAVLAHS